MVLWGIIIKRIVEGPEVSEIMSHYEMRGAAGSRSKK